MQSKKPKLKIGVIGVGHMGQYHVNVLSSMLSHSLIGIYDLNLDHAEQLATKYETRAFASLEQLLGRVDAVTIAVPTNLHYDIARKALEYDCHVLLEKPMTETVEEAKTLLELAKQKNKILQVGHVERFNGAVMELHKIVTEPLFIESKRISPFTPRIKDVGVILDVMIHDLDIVLNLVNSPIQSYHATGRSVYTDHEDVAIITLNFESGCVATLVGSRVSQNKQRILNISQDKSYINLNYTNQDIEIHRQASTAYLMTKEEIKYSQESFVEKLYVHKDNPLKSEHEYFYNCIVDGIDPFVPNEKDVETLSIALGSIDRIASLIKKEKVNEKQKLA